MLKKIRKKGAISVKTIVMVSIILISFIVILFFMGFFDYEQQVSKSACKQSIVNRHNAKFGIFSARGSIPLKCQTQLNCLTMSGDDCSLVGTEDNPVRKVKLSNDKQIAKKQIMEEFANALVECHNMLGEGELHFMPRKWGKEIYGLICSRIALDEKARKEIKEIQYSSFYKYLGEKKLQSGKSYLEYLYKVKKSEDMIAVFNKAKEEAKNNNKITFAGKYSKWTIDLTKAQGEAIVAKMAVAGTWKDWLLPAGIGVAVFALPVFISGYILGSVSIALISIAGVEGAAAGSTALIFMFKHKDNFDYFAPGIYDYEVRVLNSIGISSFEVAP